MNDSFFGRLHRRGSSQPFTSNLPRRSGEGFRRSPKQLVRLRGHKTVSSSTFSPASSGSAASASSSRRSDAQQTLEAYLQDGARSYRPPIDAWQDSTAGFTERIATNYSLPQAAHSLHYAEVDHQYPYPTSISLSKSSMAPSQTQPPQVHNRAPSTVASASRYSSCGPPSLVYDDHTSYAESSVDTEYGKIVQGVRLLEPDVDGALVQPQVSTAPVYECTFNFLGCRFMTPDEADWRLHNLSHFHGNVPPRSVACPLCDFGFDADDGRTAWEARMSHLAAHVRMGETLATSRPDFKLFRYLWQKRIIDDAEYKELNGRGTLAARSHPEDPSHTTEGPRFDERRRRVPRYPRPNRMY
ncbi:hypothetical protein BFW01_g11496 [Lasiodiplodia theobromae]|nr:hypothetical protein BFW01_g11496 [Lasiodiplodia theobromae]